MLLKYPYTHFTINWPESFYKTYIGLKKNFKQSFFQQKLDFWLE